MARTRRRATPWVWVAAAIVLAAVLKELRTPAAQRTWEGRLFGSIPYDLRWPTWERVRRAWYSPDDPRLFVPCAFGVGWTVNVGYLARRVARLVR